MRIAIAASLVLALALGCGISGTEEQPVGTPENPVPHATGPYLVTNRIDFTVEAVLPQQIALAVKTLRTFSTNPAKAMLDLAEAAGVPAVGILRAALPDVLEDKLEGWINEEVAKVKINGKPIMQYAGEIAALAEFALSEFAVDSEMEIDGTDAVHRLTALDLNPAGINFRLPIGGLAGDILTQTPTLEIWEGGNLLFSEQHFGLNYGEYAWLGLEAASTHLFGQGIRASLGKAIDCPNLASKIANKCVLAACVGHETELRNICEGGLDAVVNFTRDQITDFRVEALHLISGTARLVDDTGDGYGDRIVEGVWQAEMNLGLGLRHTPATFTGAR